MTAFDLVSEQAEDTGIPYTAALRSPGWVRTADDSWILLNATQNGRLIYTDFTTHSSSSMALNVSQQSLTLRSMSLGLNNNLLFGAYMGSSAFSYDLLRHTCTTFPMDQVEGIGSANGKTYFGVYPGAKIFELTPDQPYKDTVNPKYLGALDKHQDRPFKIINAAEKIVASSTADYGYLDGALTIYNPATSVCNTYTSSELHPELKKQGIIGLAFKEGKLYGSTTVWGGLGIEPESKTAHVFLFDMAQNKVTTVAAPQVPGAASPLLHIGDISIGPDGNIWCVSKGYLLALNPQNLEVEKTITLVNSPWSLKAMRLVPYTLDWLSNGLLVTNAANGLYILDIQTQEHKKQQTTSHL